MKILLDTNIIVDILSQRSPFFEDSFNLLNTIYDQNHIPCVSASAITDIVYILRKYIADKKKLLDTVCDDYEDAVQLQVAMENKISRIITRNQKDFRSHIVATQTPKAFLQEQEA